MELGSALKFFVSQANIIVGNDLININLLTYFPLLKNGYAKVDTIKNIFELYIKINKLKKENKIIIDDLLNKSFNSSISICNYNLIGNEYSFNINLYKFILKYDKFELINLLKSHNINKCFESFKLEYSNLNDGIIKYKDNKDNNDNNNDNKIIPNTFDFIKSCHKNFDNKRFDHYFVKDIIDLNIIGPINDVKILNTIDNELTLSYELIKIFKLIERDNVIQATTIRDNNTYIKTIEHDFKKIPEILKIAKQNKCNYVIDYIFNTNYFKLLESIIYNQYDKIYHYLYIMNIDPRSNNNSLFFLTESIEIKNMIKDVTIKKNLLQKFIIKNQIEKIIGLGYDDLSNTINDYILDLI